MRVLKLNASYEYLGVESWEDCIHLIVDGRAHTVEAYPGKFIRSARESWPQPAVIVMRDYVQTKKRKRAFAPSTRNVLIRDNFTCQYCGVKLSLKTGTKDHVVPFSKGGPTSMKNLVAACKTCNAKKDDRSCQESGMYPRNPPRELTEEEKLRSVLKTFKTVEKKAWFRFLKDKGIKLW